MQNLARYTIIRDSASLSFEASKGSRNRSFGSSRIRQVPPFRNIAMSKLTRHIGIELREGYFQKAQQRLNHNRYNKRAMTSLSFLLM